MMPLLLLLGCLAPSDQVAFSLTGPDLRLPVANQRLWVEIVAYEQTPVTLRFQAPLFRTAGDATAPVSAALLEDTRTVFAADSLLDRVTLEGLRSVTCTGTCRLAYDLRLEGSAEDDEGAVAWEVSVWAQWSLASEDDPAPQVGVWAAPASE